MFPVGLGSLVRKGFVPSVCYIVRFYENSIEESFFLALIANGSLPPKALKKFSNVLRASSSFHSRSCEILSSSVSMASSFWPAANCASAKSIFAC